MQYWFHLVIRLSLKGFVGQTKQGKASPYLKLNAMFVHFILMQGLAILLAYLGKAMGLEKGIFALLGAGVGLYAIMLAFSATLTGPHFAQSYDIYVAQEALSQETEDQ